MLFIPVVNAFNPILPTIAVVLVIISGILTPSFVLRMTASPIFQEFYKLYKVSGEHRSGNYDLWKKEPEKLRNANKKMGVKIPDMITKTTAIVGRIGLKALTTGIRLVNNKIKGIKAIM